MRRDVLGMMLKGMREYGDVVRYKLGTLTVHLVCHPDLIAEVFAHPEHYDKDTFASAKIRQVTGDGLLVTNGQQWCAQRQLVQPAFAASRIDGFTGVIVDRTQRMLDAWESAARRGEPIDVASQLMRLTYGVVEQVLFSTDTAGGVGAVEEAITVALAHIYGKIQRPFSLPSFLPTAANRRFRRAMRTLEKRVDEIIAAHRRGGGANDLLTEMLHIASSGTCPHLDDRRLRSQTITLLLAGHETTANAITWLCLLLDQHPEAAERIGREADAVIAGGGFTREGIKSLRYTSMALRETLRIYTPIWAIVRRALVTNVIGGYRIPRGTRVVISPYVTHRHPQFWMDPERFNPLRFRRDARPMHPCAYIPFGGGPRYCVGMSLARLEGLVIAAMIARRYRLRLAAGQRPEPDPGITLRCRGGLKMIAQPREAMR